MMCVHGDLCPSFGPDREFAISVTGYNKMFADVNRRRGTLSCKSVNSSKMRESFILYMLVCVHVPLC